MKIYHTHKQTISFLLLISIFNYGIAQYNESYKIPDSLHNKSLTYLENQYKKHFIYNKPLSKKYAFAYLRIAEKNQDTLNIAKAHDNLYEFYRFEPLSLEISDKIIALTKDFEDSIYPARGYFRKATFYYRNGKYDTAFKYYIETDKYAKKFPNIFLENKMKHSIGLLELSLGKKEEALKKFEEYHSFIKLHQIKYNVEYLSALFALSFTYNKFSRYEEAILLTIEGLSKSADNKRFHRLFNLGLGMSYYLNSQNDLATEQLEKTKLLFEKTPNDIHLTNCYLYLGRAYHKEGKTEIAINYFKKVDQIVKNTNRFPADTREAYEELIDIYKKNKDQKNQLKYTTRLITVDSILSSRHENLEVNIVKKYETPILLAEQKRLINTLENKSKWSTRSLWFLLLLTLLLSILLIKYRNRQTLYRKKFEELISKNSFNEKEPLETIQKPKISSINDLDISSDVINSILSKLEKFEETNGFLKSDLTLAKLSSTFNTNSSYLSKVINTFKEKTFSSYLNDLRTDYALDCLQKDRKLRNYKIKALAREFGFKSAESFSNAFKKKTGIYPSYFLKELHKTVQEKN